MILYFFIFLFGMMAGAGLLLLLADGEWIRRHVVDDEPEEKFSVVVTDIDEVNKTITLSPSKPVDIPFNVAGKPRAVPWHIRRRELEEAARSKRRRLESF
jgi:hypothetical protein